MSRFGLETGRGRSIISSWSDLTPRLGVIKYWMLRPVSHQQQISQPGVWLSLTALGAAARNIDVDQLSAEQADHHASILRAEVADLAKLARRLERRAKRG
jgi:hypothetical protein